jgi:diguanylate cyclase (GGDEF)-like protein
MEFDLPTLMAAGSLVSAFAGLFVFYSWMQDRAATGLRWWAIASLAHAIGIGVLLSGQSDHRLSLVVSGSLILTVAPALFLAAGRLLNGRRIPWLALPAGALFTLATGGFGMSAEVQMAAGLLAGCGYFAATAIAFIAGGAERLPARWPMAVLLSIHAVILCAGAVEALAGALPAAAMIPLGTWFGVIHFEAIIFALGTAVFVVAFARERSELRHKLTASVDGLTGVANRAAFFAYASERLRQCLVDDAPLSVIAIDLDGFKAINDSFGHAAGDEILRRFGATAASVVRPGSMIGRLGGEEFAVVLPDTSFGAAFVVAERIRAAFAAACREIDGRSVEATLSAGVATAHPDSTLDRILADADEGLYRAKALGRDRVERAVSKNLARERLDRVA